jgi:osmotically-inducible protein OsmY
MFAVSLGSRHVRRFLVGLALLLAVTASARSAPPWESDRLEVRDVELTLLARRAVHQDSELARCNLGVSVRQGEATVWGSVPTRDLASHALAVVGRVRGVYKVRSDLLVAGGHEEALESLLAGLASGPSNSDPVPWYQSSDRGTGGSFAERLGDLPGESKPQEVINAHPPLSAWLPHPGVTLLRPMPVTNPVARIEAQPEDRSTGGDLREAVERVLSGDERFHDIRVEINNGIVLLSGRVRRPENLVELWRAVSPLPGVRSVDLRGVETSR